MEAKPHQDQVKLSPKSLPSPTWTSWTQFCAFALVMHLINSLVKTHTIQLSILSLYLMLHGHHILHEYHEMFLCGLFTLGLKYTLL